MYIHFFTLNQDVSDSSFKSIKTKEAPLVQDVQCSLAATTTSIGAVDRLVVGNTRILASPKKNGMSRNLVNIVYYAASLSSVRSM